MQKISVNKLLLLMLIIGLLGVSDLAYYRVKAALAQLMLERAWNDSQGYPDRDLKPWPWADSWPQLKLSLKGQSFIVLGNASGESLAFGPGLLTAKLTPGQMGNSIIAGHRDTHFEILPQLKNGDILEVENKNGNITSFKVDQIDIVDSSFERPIVQMDQVRLTLVTCYPFDMNVSSPHLRYIVSGIKVL